MTIKLEQETILRVLEHPPQLQRRVSPLNEPPSVPLSSSSVSTSVYSELTGFVDFRKPLQGVPDLVEDDDTLSTASFSSDEDSTLDRRVSFCEEVVTEVWTRPFTQKEDIPDLYYSCEETARFRQEYRLEKKLLSELSVDPETCAVDEKDLSAMVSTSPTSTSYRISRVVVLHNNKLETFVDQPDTTSICNDGVDGFFDNDSFWAGSLTWQ